MAKSGSQFVNETLRYRAGARDKRNSPMNKRCYIVETKAEMVLLLHIFPCVRTNLTIWRHGKQRLSNAAAMYSFMHGSWSFSVSHILFTCVFAHSRRTLFGICTISFNAYIFTLTACAWVMETNSNHHAFTLVIMPTLKAFDAHTRFIVHFCRFLTCVSISILQFACVFFSYTNTKIVHIKHTHTFFLSYFFCVAFLYYAFLSLAVLLIRWKLPPVR